jgi:hypothetical protein
VLAIRATLGIEALVWLTDIGGLSREEAVEIMRSSARTPARTAIADATPDRKKPPGNPTARLRRSWREAESAIHATRRATRSGNDF